jgi:leucyl-tRNA synthetase
MTLAPEHELVAKITTPEQKAAVEAYVERTAKRSERERMADVKTISGVFREHMLNILYQRASSGLIGIMSWHTEQELLWQFLETKEIMLLLTSLKDKAECRK